MFGVTKNENQNFGLPNNEKNQNFGFDKALGIRLKAEGFRLKTYDAR